MWLCNRSSKRCALCGWIVKFLWVAGYTRERRVPRERVKVRTGWRKMATGATEVRTVSVDSQPIAVQNEAKCQLSKLEQLRFRSGSVSFSAGSCLSRTSILWSWPQSTDIRCRMSSFYAQNVSVYVSVRYYELCLCRKNVRKLNKRNMRAADANERMVSFWSRFCLCVDTLSRCNWND